MTNTPNAPVVNMTFEMEDRIMAALPAPVRDWLRYDAPFDYSPIQPFKAWRAGVPVAQIMSDLRGDQRRATRSDYGASHPQASLV